jgi:hypothetical protein
MIAIYLRFINLSNNPGWYSDEGTIVEIAQDILDKEVGYLAINKTTLLVARLPIFPNLLASLFKIGEPNITTLRYFTACLGVITIGLLYWVIIKVGGKGKSYLALTAAFFLAIYPSAILYNRLGFSYNLLAPLIVLLIWFLNEYLETGKLHWIIFSALAVGLGSISDLMMFTVAPVIILIAIYKKWRDVFPTLGLIILPFALYSLAMIGIDKEAFMFDFLFTFFRLGEIPIIAQFPAIVLNYASLIFKDFWWTLAVAGMFFLPTSRVKYLTLILFFTPVFMLARTTALSGLGYYYLIPLFPLIALGAAGLITEGIPFVLNFTKRGLEIYIKKVLGIANMTPFLKQIIFIATSMTLFMVVISPFIFTITYDGYQVYTEITSDISPVLVNTQDARKVLSFVNRNIKEDDLVIASPAIAWAIDSNAADFQMAIASKGGDTKHFPNDIPQDRFSFDPDYEKAAYIIIDPIWINWAVPNMVEVELMVENVKNGLWYIHLER